MKYQLNGALFTEVHSENIIFLYVRDANGAGVAGARVQVWAGPPPTGQPPYFVDDVPFRATSPSGKLEYVTFNGPMPDSRDYWMQVIDNTGAALSDPVQFHFMRGGTVWITAVLQATGGGGGGGNVPVNLDWDARLNGLNITFQEAQVAQGQLYWKLIRAHYLPEGNEPGQAGGRVNIYYTTLNENGQPIVAQRVWQEWPGDRASKMTGDDGVTDFNMSGDSSFSPDRGEHGPYTAYVDGLPSDKVAGMGLPLKRHVCFELTWRKTLKGNAPVANSSITGKISNAPRAAQVTITANALSKTFALDNTGNYSFAQLPAGVYSLAVSGAGTVKFDIALDGNNAAQVDYTYPTQKLEDAILARAKEFTWMPINTDAALYRFAQANNLGYPQTDEFDATHNNEDYIAQVFNGGIVYVRKGDWGNVKWIKKS